MSIDTTTINALLPDNTNREISPEDVRTCFAEIGANFTNRPLVVDTVQDLRDLTIYGGVYPDAVETLGCLAAGDGGGGLWYWDGTSSAADNLGTVLLPTGRTAAGRWKRRVDAGVDPRWFGASLSVTPAKNTVAIQAALDSSNAVRFYEFYETSDTVFVEGFHTVVSETGLEGGIHCQHATNPALSCNATKLAIGFSNNTSAVTLDGLRIRSENANAIVARPTQWKVRFCNIEAPNGIGWAPEGKSYQADNHLFRNYFRECKQSIQYLQDPGYSGSGGAGEDQWIIDNSAYSDVGVTTTHVIMEKMTGCFFRGNHFYGAPTVCFLDIRGAQNTTISDCYFPRIDSSWGDDIPRIKISGAGTQITIAGCRFWGGNEDGADEPLIEITVTASSQAIRVSLCGNNFQHVSAVNTVRVVDCVGAGAVTNGLANVRVALEDDNIFSDTRRYDPNHVAVDAGFFTAMRFATTVDAADASFVFSDYSDALMLVVRDDTGTNRSVTIGNRIDFHQKRRYLMNAIAFGSNQKLRLFPGGSYSMFGSRSLGPGQFTEVTFDFFTSAYYSSGNGSSNVDAATPL